MISKALILAGLLLSVSIGGRAQEVGRRQQIVSLAEGGFVAFKSEANWTDIKRGSTGLQNAPAILGSQAHLDNHIIHRVIEDQGGRFVFGYDLLVTANPTLKQFRIVVQPLAPEFERQLQSGDQGGDSPTPAAAVATFPKSAEPQTLDDGDAFTLDLLVNQGAGIKIVDVVKVTFDRSNLKELSPVNPARDFTLDAVELVVKNYRLLVNGNVAGIGKSTNGCAGALLWFYVQDRGRFIVSLVPRAGYEFQKVGIIEDNRIEFTIGDDRYEWLSSSPILPGGGTWNLWVLHDPTYAPIFGSDPAPARNKNVIEKLNDVVTNAQTEARIRAQSQSSLRNNKDLKEVQKPPPIRKPRVMVGGADRIENLWPKNP
jgi:hypothetical protein